MISKLNIILLALMVSVVYAQRPGHAPNPWDHMYTQFSGSSTTPSSRPSQGPQGGNTGSGLGDRIGSGNTDGLVFRYFNNVPIQGPEAPCIGCDYRLTNRGFIRLP